MASIKQDKVSYRLLEKLSNLVICSRCLQRGIVTPVPQIISDRHSLTNECVDCRQETLAPQAKFGRPATLRSLRN